MALFLETTSYSSSNYKGSLETIAIDGIALIHEEMQLMEAIYQADFIMHEQNKNLSESARVLKEGNFLVNVYRKVIEWVKKAWEWIKNFFSKIKDKVVEIYNRIKDHMTGNTKSMANKIIKRSELMIDGAKYILSWTKKVAKMRTVKEIEEAQKVLEKFHRDLAKKLTDADKLKGSSTVSMTYADKLKSTADDLDKEGNELAKEITEKLNELEKELEKGVSDGDQGSSNEDKDKATTENKELLAALRKATSVLTGELSKYSGALLATISAVMGSANSAAAETDTNPKLVAARKKVTDAQAKLQAAMDAGRDKGLIGKLRNAVSAATADYNAAKTTP